MLIITQAQLKDLFHQFTSRLVQSGTAPQTSPPAPLAKQDSPSFPVNQAQCVVPCVYRHANIHDALLFKYSPSGKADGGVGASRRSAEADLADAKANKAKFEKVGAEYGVPPSLLAGIASRESEFGKSAYMNDEGWGDSGNAYGIMQVDKRHHTIVGSSIDDIEHIRQAAGIFRDKLEIVERHYPDWPQERQFQRATALYNGNNRQDVPRDLSVNDGNIDVGTTGGDYSNDVWARSQYFSEHW